MLIKTPKRNDVKENDVTAENVYSFTKRCGFS